MKNCKLNIISILIIIFLLFFAFCTAIKHSKKSRNEQFKIEFEGDVYPK